MKASVKHWYDVPPKIIQNAGDALQVFAVTILSYVSLAEPHGMKWLAIVAIFLEAIALAAQKLFKNGS